MQIRFWSITLRSLLLCAAGFAWAALAAENPAAALRDKHVSLSEPLRQNQFKRPLVLDSTETPNFLKGDIYAVIAHPFNEVSAALNRPDHWCEILILHINTKYCHAVTEPSGTTLRVNIGRKTPEELADTSRVNFKYNVKAATPEYLEIVLSAKEGPLGTSDYRIQLAIVSLPNATTFLHLTYSYAVGYVGRLAMQAYLGTLGRGKVGFTVTGKQPDGQPVYIGGVRGVVERNTMRYYLAIDAFLEFSRALPAAQLENRLQRWFTAVDGYPVQLREMDRRTYLEMKRAEYARQQTLY